MDRRLFHALRISSEAALSVLYGQGWPARLARRLGVHPDPVPLRVKLTLPAPHPCPPLRVAFASDFHAGPTTHPDVIRAACRTLLEAQPDLILLGGDFVSLHERAVGDLLTELSRLEARLGKFAVLGNHDYWVDHRRLASQLAAAGYTLLTNRNVRLRPPAHHVWVCGLDDSDEGVPDADAAFAGADGVRLVVMHSPDGLAAIGNRAFDLALCGHTHGGQICLPGGRVVHVPPGMYTRRYAAGHFPVGPNGAGALIVSRGVGCSGVPVRASAAPDVVVCDIHWRQVETSSHGRQTQAGEEAELPQLSG
ncbi:MAG: metallophosphoesterase family protein [Chloroflexota bacterium]